MKSGNKLKASEKRFVSNFEKKVKQTISKYRLLSKKDKVIVGVSGGKDSTVILYLLKKLGYSVEAVTIDVLMGKYTAENLENIKKFCRKLKVKLYIVSFRDEIGCSVCYALSSLRSKGHRLKSCTVCGVLRRHLLNKKAKKIKAKLVVTGHNLDDEAQTIVMNMMRNRQMLNARIGPKPGVITHKKFVQRIKPLFFITEKDVERYSRLHNFPVAYGRCPCGTESFRASVRKFLDDYEKTSPGIKQTIVKNLLKQLPQLRKQFATKILVECKSCGEPSTGEFCRTCQIRGQLKN